MSTSDLPTQPGDAAGSQPPTVEIPQETLGLAPPLPAMRPGTEKASASSPSVRVPGFEVLQELGRGGMGVVYKARQLDLGRIVALKMILAGVQAGAEERRRFRVEGEAIGRLQHPNIVSVYEVGEVDVGAGPPRPYMALEFCPGGTLAERLAGTPLSPPAAASLIEKLAQGVQAAHAAGVVHRDLKPSNMLLAEASGGRQPPVEPAPPGVAGTGDSRPPLAALTPKITDFGLAKLLREDAGQTNTGAVMGTPSYMAPEQAQGSKDIGPACDVYALGAILYECLTGRPPFKASTALDTIQQVVYDEPAPPTRLQSRVPRDLETICLECLRKEPGKRYASAALLAADLRAFQEGRPIAARPVGSLERAWKWAKRKPALAGMAAACLVVAAVSFALVTWKWTDASRARDDARREEARALRALERAEASLYFNQVALADREWAGNNPARALAVLESCREALRGWEWHYLRRSCEGGLLTLNGHRGRVTCVAWSRDWSRLASGGLDRRVLVWDPATGKILQEMEPNHPVYSLAFSPDRRRLAAACGDGVVRLWNVPLGTLSKTLRGHKGAATAVAFGPDDLVATGGEDERVLLWDSRTGQRKGELKGHANTVAGLGFDPKGRLASVGYDNALIVWDGQTQKQLFRHEGHRDGITAVSFGPDGKRIATGGGDQAVALWDGAGGGLLQVLRGHKGAVMGVSFTPDGERLVSGGQDRLVRVWDVRTGQAVLTLSGHREAVLGIAVRGDGLRLASASGDRTVKLWDAVHEPTCLTLPDAFGEVRSAAFTPDGKALAALGEDGKLRFRDAARLQPLWTLASGAGFLAFDFGRKDLVACACEDRTVEIHDLSSRRRRRSLKGHTGRLTCVSFSPGARWLASAGHDQVVRLWDVERGRLLHELPGHADAVRCLAFHPDGELLASGGDDRTVKLWKVTGEPAGAFNPGVEQVRSLAFDAEGRLAVAGRSGEVVLFSSDLATKEYALKAHDGGALRVVFTPDAKRLVTSGADHSVKVWDARTGLEVLYLRGHKDAVAALAVRPDGKVVASGGRDQTLKLFSGEPLAR
jgi:WD40 repeat protein